MTKEKEIETIKELLEEAERSLNNLGVRPSMIALVQTMMKAAYALGQAKEAEEMGEKLEKMF